MSIELKNITKYYGENRIIGNLSFVIPSNGIYGIFGPSGKGKTTILRIIAGLEKPDSGTVTGTKDKRISMVFQEDRLLNESTVLDNVRYVSDRETALSVLEKVKLSDCINKYPSELSGGMQRRVAIARALAFDGDILILDEPFKGLERELKEEIIKLIVNYSQNKPVILVTHDEEEKKLAEAGTELT